MKKLLVPALATVLFGVLAAQVQAFGHRGCGDCCPPPPCTPCVTYVDRVVTCYKPQWQEEKVKCVVNRVKVRVEEVIVQCNVMVPKWTDVKQTCRYLVPVPRVVEQEVMRCRYVPVQMKDPCTGCAYTCMKPETYTEKVKCTVYDCKEEIKEFTVKVCHMECHVQDVKQKRYIPECYPATIETVRRYCVMVPYQTTIRVPVCVPCCAGSVTPSTK